MSNPQERATTSQLIIQAPWDTLRILLGILFFLIVGVSLTSLYPLLRIGGTALLGLITAILIFTSPGYRFQPWPLHALFGALLFYEAISLLWTPYPKPGAEHLIYHFFLYIFFVCTQLLLLGWWKTKNILDALILLGITFVALDLLLFLNWYRSWLEVSSSAFPPIGYRSSGHLLGHPNSLGGFLSLLLPIAATKAFYAAKRIERWSYVLIFLILGFGLFLTSSRGAWLAAVVGLGMTTIVVISTLPGWTKAVSLRDSQGKLSFQKAVLFIFLALTLLSVIALGAWQMSNTGHASPLDARLPVWRGSLELAQSSSLLGSGVRSFPPLFAGLSYQFHEEDVPHAHNAFLQFWSELGIVGFLLLAALMFFVAYQLWRNYRDGPVRTRRKITPFIGVFATVFAHQQVDFLFGSPFYSGTILILLALCVHILRHPEDGSGNSYGIRFIYSIMIIITLSSLVLLQQENWGYWRGVTTAGKGEWQKTAELLCANSQKYPDSVVSAANCQVASSLAGPTIGTLDFITPSAHSLDPNWHQHWENYAAQMRSEGDYDEALSAQRHAVEIAPDRPENFLHLGYILELEGHSVEALNAYTTATRLNPIFLNSYVIQNSQLIEEIHGDLKEYLESSSEDDLWKIQILITEGNYEQANEELMHLADRFQGNYRYHLFTAIVHMNHGDLKEARESLAIASFIRSQNPEIVFAQSQLANLEGDRKLADQLLVNVLEDIIFSTHSRKYYFASYGRTTLSIDQIPQVIRGSITPAILEEAQQLGRSTNDPEVQQLVGWITQASGALEMQPTSVKP